MQWHDAVSTLVELGKPYVIITVIGKRGSVPRDGGTKIHGEKTLLAFRYLNQFSVGSPKQIFRSNFPKSFLKSLGAIFGFNLEFIKSWIQS